MTIFFFFFFLRSAGNISEELYCAPESRVWLTWPARDGKLKLMVTNDQSTAAADERKRNRNLSYSHEDQNQSIDLNRSSQLQLEGQPDN